jgi:carbon-monoxide dehydrogenase large subunit
VAARAGDDQLIELLRGAAPFLADVAHDDCAHAVFVRSTVAHGRLTGVDTTAAAGAPGVVAVLTASDLGLDPFLYFDVVPPAFARPPLAVDMVRTVGDPVALVVAESAAEAVDAAELVVVDIEPEEALVDPRLAAESGAPVLHPDAGSNIVIHYDRGRIEDLFEGAAHVERGRFPNQRMASAPLEPSGIVVRPTEDGMDVWATCQGVHIILHELARALQIDPAGVRVRAARVGGGFGGRHAAPIEFMVVAAAARHLGRPLRWVETRTENLQSMVHGRAQDHTVEMGFDAGGRIVGLRVHNLADCGGYPHFGPLMPFASRKLACGPYRIDTVDYEWLAVVTTTNPVGPYRGAGQPEAVNGIERTIDNAARAMGVDPLDLRRRNMLRPDDLPHRTPTGLTYDSGDYPAALERAAALVGAGAVRAEQAERRMRGDAVQVGLGFASYVSMVGGGSEFASVSVEDDGRIGVRCGTFAHGQGHATSVGGAVAEALGVAPGRIRYIDSDTDETPRGEGTGGSRSAQMAGSAALRAAEQLLEQARELAAGLLEADPADVVVMPDGGGLGVAGVPASALSWAELSRQAGPDGLRAELDLEVPDMSHPSGTHASVVEVDTETGAVTVRAHVAVDDCGTVLDRALVEGQQHGGAAAGIGQALLEEIRYDAEGNPLTSTLADYLIPAAADVPAFVTATMDIPTPVAPNGAKGIGENGAIVAPSSVQNAVVDALSHLGVTHVDLPMTPERVWAALRTARQA